MKTNIEFKRYIKNDLSQKKEFCLYSNGHKRWYLNGKLHREDGHAIEYSNGNKEWYLNEKIYFFEIQYLAALKEYKKNING